jgi:iron uptake system component EfeO
MEDEGAVTGTPVHITGPAHGTTPGVVPVSQADLVPATQAYERYVRTQLPTLRRLTDRLRSDVDRNRFARARRDWLTAHPEYERLGAAYDAFGTLDSAINGLPDGLPGGIHDARWTGFHRVEYGLWHDESRASLLPYVDLLTTDVARLQHRFASAEIDPLQISVRAHEISENALQFVMTGRTDFGSHSQRSTVSANLQGTAVVLQIIHPLIAPRYPQLPQTLEQLQRARRDVRHADHERLDSDLSQLCELLAPIAAILEPRRTS